MSEEKFEQWAIVEIFGHDMYAGRVTEGVIGGCSFVRVDIPKIGELEGFTKFFGQGAIYGMTIVDEQTARIKAAALCKQPMDSWSVGQLVEKAVQQRLLESKPVESDEEETEDFY